MIPVFVFAAMRRSGSHFCMHRALSSVVLSGPRDFGVHINSLSIGKALSALRSRSLLKSIAHRKANHFYTDEARAAPRTGATDPCYMGAAYAWMSGTPDSFALNPSGLRMRFLAVNVEDEPVSSVSEAADWLLKAMPALEASRAGLPVFVTIRALRSIAVSRAKWMAKYGPRNIMSKRFSRLHADTWVDHYKSVSSSGAEALHYGEGVRTKGKSVVAAFARHAGSVLAVRRSPPKWVEDSVLSDGYGSSFVGSGAKKGRDVAKSLESRSALLGEFSHLLAEHPEVKEHAERFGEL